MAFAFADCSTRKPRRYGRRVDVIQFDEPAFNVYMDEVSDWASERWSRRRRPDLRHRRAHLLRLRHIKANTDWKETLGSEWRQYEDIFPAIAKSPIQQSRSNAAIRGGAEIARPAHGQNRAGRVIDVPATLSRPRRMSPSDRRCVEIRAESNIVATPIAAWRPMHRDIAEAN